MWLKKKDKVVVLSGKDGPSATGTGKRGEVLRYAGREKFVVSKVNLVKKHKKARQDERAGIYEQEAPIHQSKLMLVCPRCDTPTRPRIKFLEDQTKVRVCRNCSETIQ